MDRAGWQVTISYPSLDAINAPVTISAKEVGLSASRIYDGSKMLGVARMLR